MTTTTTRYIANAEEIEKSLDPAAVVDLIGYSKKRPQISGGELRTACPIHKGDNPNLSINLTTHVWQCWTGECKKGGHGLIDLFMKCSGTPYLETVEHLANHFGIPIERKEKTYEAHPTTTGKKKYTSEEAWQCWEEASEDGNDYYFSTKKGIAAPPGIRYGKNPSGYPSILIPLHDIEGTLQGFIAISGGGKYKHNYKIGEISGAFFLMGTLKGTGRVFIGEGVATVRTVWEALAQQTPSIASGTCGNIIRVVEALKAKYPSIIPVIVIDNDNAGLDAAKDVAERFPDAEFRLPSFEECDLSQWPDSEPPTDFNDLMQLAGSGEVTRQLLTPYPRENLKIDEKAHLNHYSAFTAEAISPHNNAQDKTAAAVKSTAFSVRPICEISRDYFRIKPAPKPELLRYARQEGDKTTFLHKEIVALLIAEGGRGKTHICAHLAACVATGIPFLGKFEVASPGGACFIVGENNQADIHRLLWKTREQTEHWLQNNAARSRDKFCVFDDALDRLDRYLFPVSVHGINASLIDGKGHPTPFFYELGNELKNREPEDGWQLIVLDPSSRFAGPEAEKDNAIATAYIALLEHISTSLKGSPTILLSHHKSKAAIRDGGSQADARGASGLTDGVRWQANLSKDKDNPLDTLFELTKTNFTSPIQSFGIKKNRYGVPSFGGWKKETGPIEEALATARIGEYTPPTTPAFTF